MFGRVCVQSASTHRVASLLRAVFRRRRRSANLTTTSDVIARTVTSRSVRNSLSRSRALILMTSLFVVCWYPLYVLTLVDPKFQQPTKLYKVLTLVAWSNATLNPLVLLMFDHHVGATCRCTAAGSRLGQVTGSPRGHHETHSGRRQSVYERVGSRLCSEGQNVMSVRHANGLLSRDDSVRDLTEHKQVPDDVLTHP